MAENVLQRSAAPGMAPLTIPCATRITGELRCRGLRRFESTRAEGLLYRCPACGAVEIVKEGR